MPILRTSDRVILFMHVPKAGGTSVERYLATKGELTWTNPSRHADLPCTPQHFHRDLFAHVTGGQAFDASFAVLRDPVARMQSEFVYRSDPLKLLQRAARPFRGGKARRIKMGGEGKQSLTFDEWVPRALKAAEDAPYLYDNHLRPQSAFVDPDVDQLFRLEDGLEQVFRWIDAVTGTGPSEGQFWEKRAETAPPKPARKTRKMIEAQYAADLALWHSAEGSVTPPQTRIAPVVAAPIVAAPAASFGAPVDAAAADDGLPEAAQPQADEAQLMAAPPYADEAQPVEAMSADAAPLQVSDAAPPQATDAQPEAAAPPDPLDADPPRLADAPSSGGDAPLDEAAPEISSAGAPEAPENAAEPLAGPAPEEADTPLPEEPVVAAPAPDAPPPAPKAAPEVTRPAQPQGVIRKLGPAQR